MEPLLDGATECPLRRDGELGASEEADVLGPAATEAAAADKSSTTAQNGEESKRLRMSHGNDESERDMISSETN